MSKAAGKHAWAFAPRFRRGAFGWRSAPAVARIKEAVAEIKAAGRKDALLAAEGAVLFLQKLSPALEHIESSSGAIGTAVNRAIDSLAPIIAKAPAEVATRRQWLEQLYQAHADEEIPYIESLGDWKTAWDHIHFRGFLGTKMIMQFIWQGCDSLLAGPLVLDLARLALFAQRRGEVGVLKQLACFFKNPMGVEEHDFFKQFAMLEEYVGGLNRV